jgi:putative flippase GtrA
MNVSVMTTLRPGLFERLRHRLPQLIRYSMVSVIATTTTMTTLAVLITTGAASATWANVIGTAVGTVPSFELNRRWVWGKSGRRSLGAEVIPFCVLSFSGLVLSTLMVHLTAAWVAGLGSSTRAVVAALSNAAAFGSLWVVQFVVLDRALFRRDSRPRELRPG